MQNKHVRDLKKIFILFFLIAILYNIYYSAFVQKRYFYPFPYSTTISSTAKLYNINKYLVLAVIKNESKFKENARSENGALGLMQIMPDTGKWIMQQTKGGKFNDNILLDPDTNIKFGSWYLSELQNEFHGNEILALAAYNAGRGNVRSWIDKYGWQVDFSDINAIPFKETQIYIRRIMHDKQMYAKYYKK